MEIKIVSRCNQWTRGTCGPYEFCCKHFAEPSQWGIEADAEHGPGRVSKLEMRRAGRIVCNYDRGWDIEPKDESTRLAYMILLQQYN